MRLARSTIPLQYQAGELYALCLTPVLRDSGLTRTELDVLLFLRNNPRYDTARDIVAVRRLSKSHVSAAVEQLARKGLLTRRGDPDNRRVIHLALTSAAETVTDAGRAAQEQFDTLLFAGFTPAERDTCAALADRLADNVRRACQKMNEEMRHD